MKYIKQFEEISDDDEQLLGDLISENPLSEYHDFYIFLASETFVPAENGLFKKGLDIENMFLAKGDKESIAAASMLDMRSRFQANVKLYHIWLPQELRDDVEGKGGRSLEPWIVELINKYKMRGTDDHGKKVLKDVKQRREDIKKYNL